MTSESAGSTRTLDGCLVVEIQGWDRWQHLGAKPWRMPRKYSFQGGLGYSPGFEVWGRVLDPTMRREQRIRVWISPTGRNLKIGPHALRDFGQLHFEPSESRGCDISVNLLLPASAAAPAMACIASIWKYLEISMFDDDGLGASVSAFAFSATRPSGGEAPRR